MEEAHEHQGGLGRHVALGTVVQQAGQLVGLVAMLAVTTALGRDLSLAEFGVYGLVSTFSAYLFFALGSAETAAVRSISAALDDRDRDRAFTVAATAYVGLGLVAGVLVAGVGNLLIPLFDLNSGLEHQARLGALAVGALTAIGFPLRLFQDLLRGTQRFTLAAVGEASGYALLATSLLLALLVFDAPLWVLIAIGGALPFFLGLAALVVSTIAGTPYHLRPELVERQELRKFLLFAGSMTVVAGSDLVISSLDRTILGALRNASAVGLYEGAARINTLVRALVGSLSTTLLPVVSRLRAEDNEEVERELFLRGTRYMLCFVVPPTVTLMVLGDAILAAWLGPQYAAAGTATAIFLAWWLVSPNTAIAGTMIVVDGRMRLLAGYSWGVAALNLVLSLALTAAWGLEGVAIGTTVAYVSLAPILVRYALQRNGVRVGELARVAWLPAYGTGAVLAAVLIAARAVVDVGEPVIVGGLAIAGALAGYVAIYMWLDPPERALFRGLVARTRE